jgi:hypothetical protein
MPYIWNGAGARLVLVRLIGGEAAPEYTAPPYAPLTSISCTQTNAVYRKVRLGTFLQPEIWQGLDWCWRGRQAVRRRRLILLQHLYIPGPKPIPSTVKYVLAHAL